VHIFAAAPHLQLQRRAAPQRPRGVLAHEANRVKRNSGLAIKSGLTDAWNWPRFALRDDRPVSAPKAPLKRATPTGNKEG